MKTFLTFNKSHELIMFDLVALKVDLQGQQQGEGQFVSLIQTTHGIAEDLKGHVLNDVLDSLLGNGRLLRSGTRRV